METVSFSVYIIIGYIQCYSGNGLVQCLYYYRLYSVLQWKRSRSVFILLSVIFTVTVETVSFSSVFILLSVIFSVTVETVSFSVYIIIGYSVTVETVSFSVHIIIGYIQLQWKRSRSVFILLSVIFSVTVETVSFSVYIIIGYSVTVETVSFSAVFILLSVIFSVTVETVSFRAVLGALKRAVGVSLQRRVLSALSADAARQLDVFGHDGDSLGVDGAQVGVLKQTDQISLAGLLQGHDSGALEAQVRLEILRDFSHQALEGSLRISSSVDF